MKKALFVLFYGDLTPRNRLQVRALKENGWSVSVIAWCRDGRPAHRDEAIDEFFTVDLPVARSAKALIRRLPDLYREVARYAAGLGTYHAVFLTHYFLLPLADRLPRRLGVRVYDAAEYYYLDISLYLGRAAVLGRWILKGLERRWLRRCHGVVTVDSYRSWLQRYYEAMDVPVFVQWNLPALADDPSFDEQRTGGLQSGERPVVTYVGGLMASKGIYVAIRAAGMVCAKYPNGLFVFIGPWLEDRSPAYELVAELGLEENVEFWPAMDYRSMVQLLSRASVGLALHQRGGNYERLGPGNGRKFFAYMQAAVPVVAPSFGGMAELVQDVGFGETVDCESPEEVAAAVCRLLADPGLASEYGRKGREAFEARFNWETISAQFVHFVEDLEAGNDD